MAHITGRILSLPLRFLRLRGADREVDRVAWRARDARHQATRRLHRQNDASLFPKDEVSLIETPVRISPECELIGFGTRQEELLERSRTLLVEPRPEARLLARPRWLEKMLFHATLDAATARCHSTTEFLDGGLAGLSINFHSRLRPRHRRRKRENGAIGCGQLQHHPSSSHARLRLRSPRAMLATADTYSNYEPLPTEHFEA